MSDPILKNLRETVDKIAKAECLYHHYEHLSNDDITKLLKDKIMGKYDLSDMNYVIALIEEKANLSTLDLILDNKQQKTLYEVLLKWIEHVK